MRFCFRALFVTGILAACATFARADSFDDLARDFWQWRVLNQPISSDDIPRIGRPAGWTPSWSKASVEKQREDLAAFEERYKKISPANWRIPRQVDYRLIGSALARVHWELDITRNWQRNPTFYVDQTLGAVLLRLLQPPPFDAARSRDIVARMDAVPRLIEEAQSNLTEARRPFAQLAIGQLKDIRERLTTAMRALEPKLDGSSAKALRGSTEKAIVALETYRGWLTERVDSLPADTAIGREAYEYFLKSIALMPYTPEQLLAMGKMEWDRSVAFEAYEKQRNAGRPELPLPKDQAAWVAREKQLENSTRKYLDDHGFMTFPPWLQHYYNLPEPAYIEPFGELTVHDDLTSPTRLKENATSYIGVPGPNLGFFGAATARDPRVIIMHEGVHYYQAALSFANEDPIRQHYYDSGANEGIGFYTEEMSLQAGLFDDSPRSRELIYSFMRLRALRVEADVKLALGTFTIDQAAEYLHNTVPMDTATARWEAAFFATTPCQAIDYQIGKIQIMDFLAEARRVQGDKFSLRDFHDFLLKNGNVPIALQKWEYLGVSPDRGREVDPTHLTPRSRTP